MTDDHGVLRARKAALRAQIAQQIRAIPALERLAADAAIAAQVVNLPEWAVARTVYAFLSMDEEVDVAPLIRAAHLAGKRVALPRCVGKAMSFHPIDFDPFDQLERHRFGFLQPKETIAPLAPDEHTLVLIPGRAFDRRGFRVGFGQGFYDRFLGGAGAVVMQTAIAYHLQLLPSVPAASYDVPIAQIVTERGRIGCVNLPETSPDN